MRIFMRISAQISIAQAKNDKVPGSPIRGIFHFQDESAPVEMLGL